jgi:hypothetical protein
VSYSLLYYYIETKAPKIEHVEIGVTKDKDLSKSQELDKKEE